MESDLYSAAQAGAASRSSFTGGLNMPHVLAKLTGVKFADVKQQLETDASAYAEHGMYLEHLWKNADDSSEVLFLLRVNDLNHCKQLMNRVHAEARRADPDAKLPQMVFLDGPEVIIPEGAAAAERYVGG
jgi:hypothetical protein